MTPRDLAALFEDLEIQLIASLKRNMTRHRKQEQDEGGKNDVPEHWEAWQSAKLRDIQRFRRENQEILGEYAPKIDAETEAMLREQYAEGGADGFFHTSDDKLRALLDEMRSNEGRVEKAALRYMDDVYRKTVLRSAVALNAGGVTLQQAVDGATQDFLAQGINCVEYANGRRVNIASYVEMALRTCSTRAMLLGEAKQRDRLGINTVLVSQYGACSDTCLPWQGKVYIDDVFQEYTGPRGGSFGVAWDGHQYLFLSIAIKAGLFHPNCRHTLTTWIRGVSTLPKPLDAKEIERVNKLEKRQRTLELRVRQAKRQAAGLTDSKAQKDAQRRVRERQKDLREFVNANGDVLRRDPWRERNDLAGPKKRISEGGKAEILKAEPLQRYHDITGNWYPDAVPNSHTVQDLQSVTVNGVTYQVDGHNVVLDYSPHEKEIAELLERKVGGELYMVPRVNNPQGVSTADYLFHGKWYDLKTIGKTVGKNPIVNRVKNAKKQSNNFVFDISKTTLSDQSISEQIEKIYRDREAQFVDEIVLIRDGKIERVLKRA